MVARVTILDRDEALTVCAKIKARYPNIDARLPNGLYLHQVSDPQHHRGREGRRPAGVARPDRDDECRSGACC